MACDAAPLVPTLLSRNAQGGGKREDDGPGFRYERVKTVCANNQDAYEYIDLVLSSVRTRRRTPIVPDGVCMRLLAPDCAV